MALATLEKSIVLIDAENVLCSWKSFCAKRGSNEKIDYKKLVDKLSCGTNLLRAYFYDGIDETQPLKKKNFLAAIQSNGIQLKTKMLKERTSTCEYCGKQSRKKIQKGVDVSLATDILRHALQGSCDICIVVSGDEDYADAIAVAKDKGIKVWVASFRDALSREMRNQADKMIFIEDILAEISRQQ